MIASIGFEVDASITTTVVGTSSSFSGSEDVTFEDSTDTEDDVTEAKDKEKKHRKKKKGLK